MVVPVQRNPSDPGSRTRMNRIPSQGLATCIARSAVRLCGVHHKKRCSHVFIDSQTHVPSQGTEFVMNFALRFGGNRTHAGVGPDLMGPATLTTRPTEYIRLVPNVPITCDGTI